MYQLDEKLMADNRAIIAIASDKEHIDPNLKPGMHVFDSNKKDTYVVSSQQRYNRLIQEDAYTNKIHYDLTFAGNLTVEKDLIVKGNLTNLETQDLIVKDNIIELNKDETGNGITKTSSGIEINRGTKQRARFLYSELTDRPQTSGFVFNLHNISLMTIYENGDVKTLKDFFTNNANINNNLSVGQNLSLEGNALIKGTLTVNQATDLKNILTVAGTASVTGATTLKNTLTVTGSTTLNNTLVVKENTTLEKSLSVGSNISAQGNLGITGNSALTGTLQVNGSTTLNNTLHTTNNVQFDRDLTVNGSTNIKTNLIVGGTTSLTGNVSMNGSLSTKGINNTGAISTDTLSTTGNASIGGTLTVTNTSTFNGAMVATDVATFNENVTMKKNLTVEATTKTKELSVDTSAVINTVLNVKGNATFDSSITVAGNSTFSNNLSVLKNISVSDNLIVNKNGQFGSSNVLGTLDVDGDTTLNTLQVSNTSNFAGDVTANKINVTELKLKTADNKISWQDGAVEHILYGSNTNTPNKGYTLFDANENDYNVVFKTSSVASKKKGFVFVNDTTPILQVHPDAIRSKNDIYVSRAGNTWSKLLVNADSHKANHSIGGHDFLAPSDIGAVKNSKGTPEMITDLETAKPTASLKGRLFFATDTKRIFQDLGNVWQIIGGQDTMNWDSITGKPLTFTPPVATESVLGGVKIGSNIIVEPDGTIHVPKQSIEYTVHVQDFVATANQKIFTISKSFLIGRNHVSPFVYGRRVPPSAFKEKSDNTIEFLEGLPAGAIVEFYVLLIPTDLSFVVKIEEFNIAANQTSFVLSQGRYAVGTNKLKIFLNGALMPRSSFREISPSIIELVQCPGAGNHLLVEYMYDPLS